MSLTLLQSRLAELLSTAELTVGTGVAQAAGPNPAAAVRVVGVTPRPGLAARLPGELLPRTPQRVSAVTVHAELSVDAGGAGGPGAALATATELWWRSEDDAIATGSGFPAEDLTAGYRVLQAGPIGWTAPDVPGPDGVTAAVHRIGIDLAALIWPHTVTPQAGGPIGPIGIRLGVGGGTREPVRVAPGEQTEIGLDVDLRSLVINPEAPGDPPPAPRRLAVSVVAAGPAPVGSVAADSVVLAGDRATVTYTAGPLPGRDELRFLLVPDDAPPLPVGAVPVEVR
jgi:hypothetical protein